MMQNIQAFQTDSVKALARWITFKLSWLQVASTALAMPVSLWLTGSACASSLLDTGLREARWIVLAASLSL